MSLQDYRRKRNFKKTPEPSGEQEKGHAQKQKSVEFVVQLHRASHLHYDFRIRVGGVLKSWALPKGPSLDPSEQRLAVQVEDHPVEYASFEGIIPPGNYGAGTVLVWDRGPYLERNSATADETEAKVLKGLARGHVTLLLEGAKLQGEFALVRLTKGNGRNWLFLKKRDQFASREDVTRLEDSVKTGRTLDQIAGEAEEKGEVWISRRVAKKAQGPTHRAETIPEKQPTQEKAQSASIRASTKVRVPELPATLLSRAAVPTVRSFPRKLDPMTAVSWRSVFDHRDWIFETDSAGVRVLAQCEKGRVRLVSRKNLNLGTKYPEIVSELAAHSLNGLLDGYIVGDSGTAIFWVHDLLFYQGKDFRDLPLVKRKRALQLLFKQKKFNKNVLYRTHLVARGHDALSMALGDAGHGVFARHKQSRYLSGTSEAWLKIEVEPTERGPVLTHLDKIYFPQEGITKGDLIDYYREMAPYLLPHLKDRLQSMHRHPNGILEEGFFQKDLVGHHPRWVKTHRVFSRSSQRSIDYLLCQNVETLLYMANLGCIELNPWFSVVGALEKPTWVAIDLDPGRNAFPKVIQVALEIHEILGVIKAPHYLKTSGGSGLHIGIPLGGQYSFESARNFVLEVCQVVTRRLPDLTSLERTPAKRNNKIYLDCFQNAYGQTLASVYCVRPRAGACVSTPLLWKELKPSVRPQDFSMEVALKRVKTHGDLWKPILTESANLELCLKRLKKAYS